MHLNTQGNNAAQKHKWMAAGKSFGCLLVLWLTTISCSSAVATPPTQGQTQSIKAAEPLLQAKITDLAGEKIEYAALRVANPRATLVFENGLMLDLQTWEAVAQGLNHCCNLLFYNRPGVGHSESEQEVLSPALSAARLQQLLQQQKLTPPYVLIGHSLGGQYAQVFTKRYPEQVDALLLVDALPLGLVKPATDFPWYTRTGLWLFAPQATRQEIANINDMGRYLLQEPQPFNKPMIRLVTQTATPQPKSAGLVKNLLNGVIYAEDFGVWALDPAAAEQRMNDIYPQAEVRTLVANHRVQEQMPGVVVDAIFRLLEQRRQAMAANAAQPSAQLQKPAVQ
ncbi:alpha/beta hydrolase [Rheinheimera texasensis]|uniref:alpha/beta fold hydrolase n=1 Tax=Rheinheimera texasensis TaxID=306205 RepID=UPI0032B2320F